MNILRVNRNLSNFIFLLAVALNFWIWRIFTNDLVLAIVLILLSVSLYMLLSKGLFLKLTILLFIIASILTIKSGFDKDLLVTTYDEENKLNDRHPYYAVELGNLYLNRFGTFINKKISPLFYQYETNFFSSLDLNLYFFASHPRERLGVEEFKKYNFLFLPVFLVGTFFIVQKKPKIVLIYLLAAGFVSGVISQNYRLGPVLLFPFFTTLIAFGLQQVNLKIQNR